MATGILWFCVQRSSTSVRNFTEWCPCMSVSLYQTPLHCDQASYHAQGSYRFTGSGYNYVQCYPFYFCVCFYVVYLKVSLTRSQTMHRCTCSYTVSTCSPKISIICAQLWYDRFILRTSVNWTYSWQYHIQCTGVTAVIQCPHTTLNS